MLFLQSLRSESWSFASYVCRFFLFFFSFFFVHLFSRDRFLFLSLFVSLGSLGPSLRLILSRVYLIALTKRELSSRRCPLNSFLPTSAAGIPFSAATRDAASSSVLPSILPFKLQRTTWHLRLVRLRPSLTLAARRFFTRLSLCFANSFSRLFRDLSHLSLAKRRFPRSGQRRADFLSFNSKLCLWIFYSFFIRACRLARN